MHKSLGFYEIWLNQGIGNYKSFLSLLKQRLTDTFIQNWLARLGESTRADFYKTFARFQMQPYLEKVNTCICKFSQAFSKLRVSSHRLEIEAGRWTKLRAIPRDDRKCHICEILEDEFHFVIECPMYLELRKRYISKYYWRRPSMFKFIELINSSNTNCIRKLSDEMSTYMTSCLGLHVCYNNKHKRVRKTSYYMYILLLAHVLNP